MHVVAAAAIYHLALLLLHVQRPPSPLSLLALPTGRGRGCTGESLHPPPCTAAALCAAAAIPPPAPYYLKTLPGYF